MRAGVLHGVRFARGWSRRRRASPFGSVVTGSLGLPSGLPAVDDREGFPDMSRCAPLLTERQGKISLPDKEFRYLRTVHCCYSPNAAHSEGWPISDQLSRSPVRSDYLISSLTCEQLGV